MGPPVPPPRGPWANPPRDFNMINYMFMRGAGDNTGGAGGNTRGAGGNTGWGGIQVVVIAIQVKMKENKKNKKEKVYNS